MVDTALRRLVLAAALAPLALSGCGGGESAHYDATATETCLNSDPVVESVSREDADYIALAATEGGYLVEVGETRVNVSFKRNETDAHNTFQSYALLAEAGDFDTGGQLFQRSNVVLVWDDTPTEEEREAVENCLTESES